VAEVVNGGVQVAIVVGGGNIFRGVKASAAGMDRATADYIGMIATVMNALTLQDAGTNGSADAGANSDCHARSGGTYIRRRAIRHLERAVVILCWIWKSFFTTDTTAALRALK